MLKFFNFNKSRALLLGLCSLYSLPSSANVIQYFTGISYDNPAAMFQTKNLELILGGTGIQTNFKYSGTALNLLTNRYQTGINDNYQYSFLPYFRIAKRLNDKVVFGFDVKQPYHGNINWGNDAFTRFASTQTRMIDVEYNPRLSVQLSQNLIVGGGLNINQVKDMQINVALPTGPNSYANLINKNSGWAYGWNLGLFYIINPQNMIDVSYFSRVNQKLMGTSTLGMRINPALSLNVTLPATTIFHYLHIFNPKWLVSAKAIYSQWHTTQTLPLLNTAAPPPAGPNIIIPMNYSDSWAFTLATRVQATPEAALLLIGVYDNGPEKNQFRTINFPSDTQYFLAIGGDFQLNKKLSTQIVLGHGWSDTSVNNMFTNGKIDIHANVIDWRFTYKTD